MSATVALTIGTRASALAMVQATILREALDAIDVETRIVTITTDGDVRAPDTAWGEGAFVTAIETALIDGRIDVAIHSAKDVPTDEDRRLAIAAYLPRADPRDALVVAAADADVSPVVDLTSLPVGSRVGTDSPRRTAFLLARRPDLQVHPIHGNVDTRLRRLDAGETDALVLASAGLDRLGRSDRIASRLNAAWMPPAPGQGALAIQTRSNDTRARDLIAQLDHPPTRQAVELEGSILARSGGGCRAPLGVLVDEDGEDLVVTAGYARPDGGMAIMTTRRGAGGRVAGLAAAVVDELAERATRQALDDAAPRVLLTRPVDQSAATALALVDRGFAPLVVPSIAIENVPSGDLDDAVREFGGFEWVVITSVNALRALTVAAAQIGVDVADAGPSELRWAAIGRTTANAMRESGIRVDFRPARADVRTLAAELPIEPGSRLLLPRGDLTDDALPSDLTGRGAVVTSVTAYRTTAAPAGSIPLLEAALTELPVAVVVTSGSTVRGLLALSTAIGAEERVRAIPLVAIGSSTATEARRLGLTVSGVATSQGPGGLADAVAEVVLAAVPAR